MYSGTRYVVNIVCDNGSNTSLNTQVEEELQGNGADYIGIHNLELRFKIQKTEPIYVDLSVIEEEELELEMCHHVR